jgi:hypothetical protein
MVLIRCRLTLMKSSMIIAIVVSNYGVDAYVIDLIVVIPGKNKSSGLFESAAGIEERNYDYIDNNFIDIDNSILLI